MAKIKSIPHHEKFILMSRESREAGEGRDCAVKAISLLTDTAYEEVRSLLDSMGRKKGHGVPLHDICAAIRTLGFDLVQVDLGDIIASYPKPHCNVLKNVTTHHPRRFPSSFDASERYLMVAERHVAAMVEGEVMDWSVNNSLRLVGMSKIVKKQA